MWDVCCKHNSLFINELAKKAEEYRLTCNKKHFRQITTKTTKQQTLCRYSFTMTRVLDELYLFSVDRDVVDF